MNTRRILIIALILSVGINAGVGTVLFSRQKEQKNAQKSTISWHRWSESDIGTMLNLDERQIVEMESIQELFYTEISPLREKLREKRRELIVVLRGAQPDMEKVDAVLSEIAGLQTEIERSFFKKILRMKEILTPEQEETFFRLFEERIKRPNFKFQEK